MSIKGDRLNLTSGSGLVFKFHLMAAVVVELKLMVARLAKDHGCGKN